MVRLSSHIPISRLFRIRAVSLPNGLQVWWDGYARLYIDAPGSLKKDSSANSNNLRGLCGDFNGNQADDFTTPDGDVENDAGTFAERYVRDQTSP